MPPQADFSKGSEYEVATTDGVRLQLPPVDQLAALEKYVCYIGRRGEDIEACRRFEREMRGEGLALVEEYAMHWSVKRELRRNYEGDKLRSSVRPRLTIVVVIDHKELHLIGWSVL